MGRRVGGAEGPSARLRTPAGARPPAPQTQLCLSAVVLCSQLFSCGVRGRAAFASGATWPREVGDQAPRWRGVGSPDRLRAPTSAEGVKNDRG